jgi:HSP20 family protein
MMRLQTVPTLFDRWLTAPLPLSEPAASVRPGFDLVEYADRFEIAADLPGFRPEDVEVEYSDRTLRVSGQRGVEEIASDSEVHLRERRPLRFRRLFALGDAIDVSGIEARFSDGVLRVSVPKSEAARPREIPVS